MATGKPFMSIEEKIQICKEYTQQWSDFFKMFAEGLENRKIFPNEEVIFDQIVTLLAFKHYEFSEMMGEFLPDPEGIMEVLCNAPSMQALKEMSDAQFSKLQVEWHSEFIAMNKCLGKLLAQLPVEKRNRIQPTGAGPLEGVRQKPQPAKKGAQQPAAAAQSGQ